MGTGWVMVRLDPRAAAKGGMPEQLPVPQEEISSIEKHGIQRDRVVPWLELFVKRFPTSPHVPALQNALEKAKGWSTAAALLKDGHWQKAGDALRQILAQDPADPSAHFNLGAVCRNLGDLPAALDHYAKAEAVFNDEGVFFTNRGRTFQQLGRRPEAIADFQRALELMPGDEFTMQRLAELGELVEIYGDPKDPSSRSFISRADYAKAVELDLRKHESDFEYLLTAAHRHALEDQSELCQTAAGLALKLHPDQPQPWLYMGLALWRLGRAKDALESMKRHLELDPKSAVGWTNMAKIHADLGDAEASRGALWKAMELDANQRHAVEMLASNSEEMLRALIEKFPASWATHAVLAGLQLARNDSTAALQSFDLALERGAPDEVIAACLGELGKAGRAPRICEIADALPDLDKRAPEVRWNAAQGYKQAGRKKDADRILKSMAEDESIHPQWRLRARR